MFIMNTAELRVAWGPACKLTPTRVVLYGGAPITVDYRCKEAFTALSQCLERHAYQADRLQTGAYNCRPITGGQAYSLHAYGIAVDINWSRNPYGPRLVTDMPKAMVDDILAIYTNNERQVFRWGGNYTGNKDAMHYEIVCSPADLATGIAAHDPPPVKPDPPRPPTDDEEDMRSPVLMQAGPPGRKTGQVFLVYPSGIAVPMRDVADLDAARFFGAVDNIAADSTALLGLAGVVPAAN